MSEAEVVERRRRLRRKRLVVHLRRVTVPVRDLRFGDHFVDGAGASQLVRAARPARAQARQHDGPERQQQRLGGHRDHGQRAQRYQRAARHQRSAHHVIHEVVFFPCRKPYNLSRDDTLNGQVKCHARHRAPVKHTVSLNRSRD